jgi:hypothetical protein
MIQLNVALVSDDFKLFYTLAKLSISSIVRRTVSPEVGCNAKRWSVRIRNWRHLRVGLAMTTTDNWNYMYIYNWIINY